MGVSPGWSGPSWNRPSWGDGWAPPWARTEEPAGHRAAGDDEPTDRASHDDESTGRRAAREDRAAAEWAPDPVRPYEPARVDPPTGYEPPRPEPIRPYGPVRAESAAGPESPHHPEPTRPFRLPRADADPRPVHEPAVQRPSWAGPPVPVTPFGTRPEPPAAPPAVHETPAGPPPAAYAPAQPARAAGEPADEPRRASEQPPAEPAGVSPVSAAPASFDSYRASRPTSAPPYAARRSAPEPPAAGEPAAGSPPAEPAPAVLPQRVPAEPDVPVVPEPPAVEPSAETPELARIATHLRRDDEPAPLRERPEGFDVNAILDAVREVAGVRDAALRRTPAGAHSLRLDLADGADPADVSRLVARLLQERMGLAAAPQNLPGAPALPPPPVRRRSAAARADRFADLPPAEPRSGTPRSRVDEATDAPARAVTGSGPAEEDPAAKAGVGRPAPNRPAENRSGEGRFGGTESRAGRLADAPGEAGEPPRRRRQSTHRGRATVDETSLAAAPSGMPTGSPVTLGTSYSGGQMTTTETAPSRPLDPGGAPGPRVVIDHVLVSTFGLDATTEVRLLAGDRAAEGHATGPAVDGYVLRLCAVAAAAAVDELLAGGDAPPGGRGRCFVEHAAVVPFGNCEVATVVALLVCDGWVEQLAGSALVAGDPRQAVVRATLAAVNRRLEALLA
ncbi:hypothetical protein AB0H28_02055 [Micromonospora sp. NPDC050980]|uniref:hypothetical protein n=1 Tax=Micromonospora sp. NPDC050980 TaxID=3155161 RepID=UPI00340BD438